MNFNTDTPGPHNQFDRTHHNATMSARIILMVLAAITFIGCSANQKVVASPSDSRSAITVTEQDDGKSIELAKGQTLFVRLASNWTTGYQWMPQGDPGPLELLKSDVARDALGEKVVGVGGTQVLQYAAKSAGKAVLKLEYRRSWEKDVAAAKSFAVTVVVK
jgi:inhibitor of cysteine peptidase